MKRRVEQQEETEKRLREQLQDHRDAIAGFQLEAGCREQALKRLEDERAELAAALSEALVEVRALNSPEPPDDLLSAVDPAPAAGPAAGSSPAEAPVRYGEYGLLVTETGGSGLYPVGKGRLLIGRAAECDVRVGDAYTSRRHAAVLASDDGVVIEDLGSVNGLLVNGQAVVRAVLRDGDVVEIGGTRFRFVEYLAGAGRSR